MESSQEAHQPNNQQSPLDISSQRKPSFIQDDQDFFCFLKSREKFPGPRPFFSKNGLSQDIIQVTEAEPDIALEVFYALYNTLWPQIEKQSGSLKDAWTNFIGVPSLKGILWSPEQLMNKPQDIKGAFAQDQGEKQVFRYLDEVVESIFKLKEKLAKSAEEIFQRKEIIDSLDLLHEFYTEYRKKIKDLVTVILENKEDSMDSYHALENLLEPKAVMIGDIFADHWAYRIPRKKAEKILSRNKQKDQLGNYSNEGASHSVAALPEKTEASEPLVYFKANGSTAIQPEKEFMLYSLYKQLQIPVPETALLILTNVFENNPEYYFAVQASEAVPGESALEACQKKESIFDQDAYVSQVVGALLTNPFDGRFENFKYSPKYKTLISIDNDLIFTSEFRDDNGEKIANVKSILYLLPRMDFDIPEATKTFFTTLDPNLIILSWLKDLSKKNKEYNLLFTRLSFQNTRWGDHRILHQSEMRPRADSVQDKVFVDSVFHSNSFYPQIFVSKSLLSNVTEKMKKLKKTLKNSRSVSTQILFENVSPVLGKYYQKLRSEHVSPEEALNALCHPLNSSLQSFMSSEEWDSLMHNQNSLRGNITPEKCFNEYREKLASGKIPPLEKFIQSQIRRKREGLLNLSQAVKELRLLIQEGLIDIPTREVIEFCSNISKVTETDDLIEERAFLSSKLPDQELMWLSTLERYFVRGDCDVPEDLSPSSVGLTDALMERRRFVLTESQKQKLFDSEGNIQKNKSLKGRSKVTCFPEENPELYLKQYPEFPGYEFASTLFMRMLGITHLPYHDLMIVDSKYPVLLMQKVNGDPVLKAWQNPEAFSKLDPIQTGLLIIAAILLNPEDGKEDNFILSPDGKYLIPIDNDHYFLPSTFQQGRGVLTAWTVHTALQTKTLLFCLDEMQREIPAEVKERILKLNFDKLLISWMRELAKVDDKYKFLVDEKQQEIFLKNGTALRISFYPKFIQHLYWKVNKIQDLLRSNPKRPTEQTPLSLLKAVEPFAARCYQDSFQPGSTVQSRFKVATSQLYLKTDGDGCRLSVLNTQSMMNIINKSDLEEKKMWPPETLKVLKKLIKERNQNKEFEQDLLCKLDHPNEESIWITLFGNPLLEAELKNFFKNPKEGLVLKGSKLITRSDLKSCFAQTPEKGAKIKFLSLPNSPLLDNKVIKVLVEGCPNLECLNVSGCLKLEEIVTAEGEFPVLTRLEAKDCLNLKKLESSSPLRVLRIGTHQKIEILVKKSILDIFAFSTQTNQFDFWLEKGDSFQIKYLDEKSSFDSFFLRSVLEKDMFEKYFRNPTITIGTHSISSVKDLGIFITSVDTKDFSANKENIQKMAQSNLINLKSLQLPEFSQEGLGLLKGFIQGDWPKLNHLNFSENEISDEGLAILEKGNWPQLEMLNLSSVGITRKGLLNFALKSNWLKLKEIVLSGSSLQPTDFPNNILPINRDLLITLNLSSNKITKSEITLVVDRSRWPNLKHLNLSFNEINDEGVAILFYGNWPLLEFLDLEKTQITLARIKPIIKTNGWSNLKHLNMSYNDITNEGFMNLSHGNWLQLENLNMVRTKVTNKGLLTFYSNVDWPKLKEINFSPCIDENLASSLLQKKPSQVEKLDFDHKELTLGEIEVIANSYKFEGLKYLNLSNNEIFDNQFLELASGEWPSLEELFLKNTKITSQGMDILVNQMNLPSLKKLDISENIIGDQGLKALTRGQWPLFQHLVYYETNVTLQGNITLLENFKWTNLRHLEHSLTESFYNHKEDLKRWSLPDIILTTAPIYYQEESILITVLNITWFQSKEIYLKTGHNGLSETIMILPREKLDQLEHLKLSLSSSLIQPRRWPSDIKILDLSNNTSFSDENKLESLLSKNWPQLEHLDLSKTDITTNGIQILTNKIELPYLKKIEIAHNKIFDEGLKLLLLGKWPLLESLNLAPCRQNMSILISSKFQFLNWKREKMLWKQNWIVIEN